jgi:hypothetical protein
MSSIHRLRRGLLGYLIPFATHAFVFQRQGCPSKLPLHLVFLLISTDFTPTPAIPLTSSTLKFVSFNGLSRVKLWDLTIDFMNGLHTLYAQ